ncbi:unnamed protein product [Adineta ricciae]|uniref:TLC domain-containing protein n=1 Tax=Adineta ricciae TaxID=249248 RepID=A0A815DXY1_ADIRI|nr:unnamed protein product [Adineta ricciae]CAF1651127.1 unnamed protein product [Adineta ricciae]
MSENVDQRFQYLGNLPLSNVPIWKIIFSSTLFHVIFFQIIPSRIQPLIKSYIISTFHAIVSVLSVTFYFLKYEINFKQINRLVGGGVFGTGDEFMVYNVCYSIGYLLYDLILMIFYKSVRSASAVVHHILIIISFLIGLFTQVCHPCHFYFLAEELSTIPLNLKTIYRTQHRFHSICSMLFVIFFFLSRLIFGSIICFYGFRAAPQFFQLAWLNDDKSSFLVGLIQAFLCILSRALNFYWAYLIYRKIFPSKSKED